jgi:Terpene synthase family 2, C-terminal metal binding
MSASVDTAVALLPFYCPFDEALNPCAGEIEARCIEWIDRFRLYETPDQRERLIATKAAEIYSRALPDADAERVADVAKWLYWGFATDDLLYDNGPVSVSTRDFLAFGALLVRISEEPRARFAWEPPYSEALRDLTRAIYRHASPQQRLDWAHTARAWFFGMAWDVANAERGTPPALNDYLMMRMHTGGLHSWITTLCIANRIELNASAAASGAVRALTEAFSTLALLFNDLMSYAKELANGDTSSNIVSVVAQERECSPQEAVPEAYALADRIAFLFLTLRAQLLAGDDERMRTFIAGLEHSWRGILDWGFSTPRYARGGDPNAPILQAFPGWASKLRDAALEPLPYPSIAWWWEEIR